MQVKSLKYTSSAIMFYWATDKPYTELETHNMFLAKVRTSPLAFSAF